VDEHVIDPCDRQRVSRDSGLDQFRGAVPFGEYLLEGSAAALLDLGGSLLIIRNPGQPARNFVGGIGGQMRHRVADRPFRAAGHRAGPLFLARITDQRGDALAGLVVQGGRVGHR
jgi:hypothetical protein